MRFVRLPVSRGDAGRRALAQRPLPGLPRYLHGASMALPNALQAALEETADVDLSRVRLHADSAADMCARQHDALAVTFGPDIYFRRGAFDPSSEAGTELLIHELTHVLQQDGGGSSAGIRESARLEGEADREGGRWLRGERPHVSSAPRGDAQCQPDQQGAKKPQPVSAAEAAAMKPPLYTDYFDEVVPGILEAVSQSGEVPTDHALWLVIQSYGEQSPLSVNKDKSVSYYLPSEHHNRLFNEHANVVVDPLTKEKSVAPGQESPGVSIHNLPQKEFLNGKWVTASSPTFGYDSPARSTAHHLELLKARRAGVWNALKDGNSFEGFVASLQASGYATEPAYVEKLKSLQNQVRQQVTQWIKYRLPELRQRVQRMVAYCRFLEEQRQMWAQRLSEEPDPVGANARESARIDELARYMQQERDQASGDLKRLEKFSAALNVKVPSP